MTATAEDGTPLRAWLALPRTPATEPAPLLLWVHGGPLHSWNSWSWRWNPWLMAARGYAVLLPDPALSTGYGQRHDRPRLGRTGAAPPYTDLMAITDAAEERPDIDETRTAAMGGSFGGYMANWVAGHTDRFEAIVTHASLWALDQFGPTTDAPWYWLARDDEEMADAPTARTGTPTRSRRRCSSIHGDKDYRVPIGEALRLWWDLAPPGGPGRTPHRFLYFPDENHWILKPQHAMVWYQTVLAFLGQHVLGEPFEVPDVLR